MDLRDCIASTLSPDSTTRVQAELTLKSVFVHIPLVLATEADCYLLQAEEQPGFPNALLDILQGEQDNGVRLSSMSRLSRDYGSGECSL